MSKRVAPSIGCGYLLVGVLCLGGLACLALAAQTYRSVGARVPPSVWVPALIGAGLFIGAWRYLAIARRLVAQHAEEERHRAAHPDEPWLWRREWLEEHLASEDGKGVGPIWFFAVIWNGLSLPGVIHFLQNPPRDKLAYLVFLFPVVGLGILGVAIYLTAQLRKYGRIRFRPATLPGALGTHLRGVIEVPARVNAPEGLRVTLVCVRQQVVGVGKNRRVVETVKWEHAETLSPEKVSSAAGRTEIPVRFFLPADLPASDVDPSDDQIIWRLTAKAATPGIDFSTRFHLPVFAVPGLSDADDLAPAPEAAPRRPAPAPLDDAELRAAGIERRIDGWSFDARRLRGITAVAVVFQLFTLGLLIFFIATEAHPIAWIGTGIVQLVSLLFAYDLLHARHEMRLVGDELIINDRVWFRPRQTRLPRAEVRDLRREKSVSIGATQYHRLILVGRPLGDSPAPPHAREPFATRKLRRALGRAVAAGADATALRARLAAAPSFEVRCAGHIPGTFVLDAIRAEILERLARRGA